MPPPESRGSSRRDNLLIYGLKRADYNGILDDMERGILPDVEMAVPLREAGLDIVYRDKRADKCATVATTPKFIEIANLAVDRGRFLTAADMAPDRSLPVCVLGAGVAKQLFGNEDPVDEEEPRQIRLQSNFGSKEYTVVGVLKPVGMAGGKGSAMTGRDLNYDVYFPLPIDEAGRARGEGMFGDTIVKRSQGSREMKRIELSQIYVRVSSVTTVKPTAAALTRMMQIRHSEQADVTLDVPLELLRQFEEQQWVWNIVLLFIAALSLIVGGIGIMNITLATVTERTREIGIRRALGGKKRHIITQFLIETTVLSGIGGVVGVAAGIAAPPGVTWAVKHFAEKSFPTHVTATSVIVSFSISAAVGILAGLYPAIVAANKDPIESLRHD